MKWESKGPYVFEGSDCIAVCDTDNGSAKQYEKNAKMMVASKDLMEAAEFFRSGGDWGLVKAWIVNGASSKDRGVSFAKLLTAAQVKIDAALSKAEGYDNG